MKVRLLRKIRKNAGLERRNSRYRAIVESGWLWSGASSLVYESKEEAIKRLRYLILTVANSEFKRKPIKYTYKEHNQ